MVSVHEIGMLVNKDHYHRQIKDLWLPNCLQVLIFADKHSHFTSTYTVS